MAVVDNGAGWKIDTTSGNMVVPSGKTVISAVDSGLMVPIRVRLCATAALPAYTASGGPGPGRILTANANGAAAAVDGITPALNDLMMLPLGASAADNGIWKLTTVGDGSNPFVWTRSTLADTSAKILGSTIIVTDGVQGRGTYQFATTAAVTVDTDPLFWIRTGADTVPTQQIMLVDEDFLTGGLPAAGVGFGRSSIIFAQNGTSALVSILTNSNSATRIGILQGALGTTTTGRAALSVASAGTSEGGRILPGTNVALFGQFKMQVTKLSDGTDTYQWFVGLADSITAIPSANCIGFVYTQASDTHWRAITSNASTTTITNSAATVTAGADDVLTYIKDYGADSIRFYANGVLFATHTTNIPKTNPVGFTWAGLKSAGTTAGSNAQIDSAYAWLRQPARAA